MTRSAALVELVRDGLEWGMRPAALMAAAESQGHDLAELLDLVMQPWDHFAAEDALDLEALYLDPVGALIQHAGLERATAIAARSRSCAHVDIATKHAQWLAGERAHTALRAGQPVREVYVAILECEAQRPSLLRELGDTRPLADLADLAPHLSERDVAELREVLQRRASALDAAAALLDQLDERTLLRALETLWGVELSPDDTVIGVMARLSTSASRPLGPVARLASERTAPEVWIPVLRLAGFKASHAALVLRERGLHAVEVVGHLQRGGYEDAEVLTGLLENGIGPRRSVQLLHDEGWSLDRMVESLHRRGTLLPEVRGHLDDLGVPAFLQAQIVLRHWDRAAVALVFGVTPKLPGSAGE